MKSDWSRVGPNFTWPKSLKKAQFGHRDTHAGRLHCEDWSCVATSRETTRSWERGLGGSMALLTSWSGLLSAEQMNQWISVVQVIQFVAFVTEDLGNTYRLPESLLLGPSAGFSTSLSRYSGEQGSGEDAHRSGRACGQCGEDVSRMLVSRMLVGAKIKKAVYGVHQSPNVCKALL